MRWGRYKSETCSNSLPPCCSLACLIKYIKCPIPPGTSCSYSFLLSNSGNTYLCIEVSLSGVIKSNFHKCRHSSLSNLHLSAHPLTFILVLFSKCALCECSHSCLSIKILCLPAWFTKLFCKILWSPSVGSGSVSNFLLDSIFQKDGLYFLNTLSQAPIHHI